MNTVPYSELKRLQLKLASPRLTVHAAYIIHQRARKIGLPWMQLGNLAYEKIELIGAKDRKALAKSSKSGKAS